MCRLQRISLFEFSISNCHILARRGDAGATSIIKDKESSRRRHHHHSDYHLAFGVKVFF